MPKPIPKSGTQDRLLPLVIGAAFLTLAVGFAAVWFYLQYTQ